MNYLPIYIHIDTKPMSNPNSRRGSVASNARKRKKNSIENETIQLCCCGRCENEIKSEDLAFQCPFCDGFALSKCVGVPSIDVYDFLKTSPNFVFSCDCCRAESLPVTAHMKRMDAKIDLLVDTFYPAANVNNVMDANEVEKGEAEWQTVASKGKKKSFAEVASTGVPSKPGGIMTMMAQSFMQTMEEKDKVDKMNRTIVLENMPCTKDGDDLVQATQLCTKIHPSISVLGVHRMKQIQLSESAQRLVKSTPRPPILKVFLRSEEEKKVIMGRKSCLQNSDLPSWMQKVYVRPSLPLAERIRKSELLQVAFKRNGPKAERTNRHIVWLNPRTETFELRQIVQGKWVRYEDTKKLDAMEMDEAKKQLEKLRHV